MSSKKEKNYYEILEVSPLASPKAIKQAYRRQARLHHPDKNKDNPEAGEVFKKIHQAYQVLSDPFKRKAFEQKIKKEKTAGKKAQEGFSQMYDSFHTYPAPHGPSSFPAEGTPQPSSFPSENTNPSVNPPYPAHNMEKETAHKKKSFSLHGLKDRFNRALNPDVVSVQLSISLEEAILGGEKSLSINVRHKGQVKKQTFLVKIPPNAKEGQAIKINSVLKAYVVYEEHPLFRADGDHIRMDLPVPWTKAILGGEVRIPTPRGELSFHLPAGTHGGHVIQLKGQGFPLPHSKQRGHMLVTIVIDIPSQFSKSEKEWISRPENQKALCPKVAEFEIKAKLLLKNRKTHS